MAQQKIIRYVATNDRGHRVGESHQKARHSDALVEKVRDMHEEQGMGYKRIAKILALSVSTVRQLCTYNRRADFIAGWRRIEVMVEVEG